jgi:hypothetical protein
MPLAVVACRAAELGQAIPHFKDSFAATAAAHFRGWPSRFKDCERSLLFNLFALFPDFSSFSSIGSARTA